jgi:hypothetical protein
MIVHVLEGTTDEAPEAGVVESRQLSEDEIEKFTAKL